MGGIECPRAVLEQKLQALNSTQQSIEGTSKWLLFYTQDASNIVRVWLETFLRAAAGERRLALLYLANHVLQEGRKKGGKAWGDEFAKVIVKAFREFAPSADDKARKSAERIVKVWEERRVFSPSHTKHLKEALKAGEAAPTTSAPDSTAAPTSAAFGAGGSRSSQVNLNDMLLEVTKAEQSASFVVNRVRQIKASVATDGTVAEVASARDVYTNCVKTLHQEVAARRRVLKELRAQLSQQEEGLSKAEDLIESYEPIQRSIEDRFRMQQQQQAAAAAAAATAAPAAALGGMGMAGPNPSVSLPATPAAPSWLPGTSGVSGPAAPATSFLAGMVPVPNSGPAGAAPAPDLAALLMASTSGQAAPGAAGQAGLGGEAGGALPATAPGTFQLADEVTAMLAAHLQSASNADMLTSLAQSLAEFMPQVEQLGAGGAPSYAGMHQDTSDLGLGAPLLDEPGFFASGFDNGGAHMTAAGGANVDEYDPNDPI